MIRATITDQAAIEQIKLDALTAYLQRTGWTMRREPREGVCAWRAPREVLVRGLPRWWQILPETDGVFADQTDRVAEAIAMIAALEDRSQLDVFVDLGGDLHAT